MQTCKNCENQFTGNFCNNCGQSARTYDINFKHVVQEMQHNVFHMDRGFFYTIKELSRRPGVAISEYITGKRVDYFKPIPYVLLLSTVYVLLTHAIDRSTSLESFFSGALDGASTRKSEVDELPLGFFLGIVNWLKNNYGYTMLLSIPITSLGSYLAFRKSGCNYFQHITLNAYITGQTIVFYILLVPFSYFFTSDVAEGILAVVRMVIGVLFTFWVYFQFFNVYRTIPKLLRTLLTYMYSFFLLAFLTSLFIVINLLVALILR